jgi:hypothetical protein
MSYEEVCRVMQQPGIPAHLAPPGGLFLEAQARAARERRIAEGQAQFLFWLAAQPTEDETREATVPGLIPKTPAQRRKSLTHPRQDGQDTT